MKRTTCHRVFAKVGATFAFTLCSPTLLASDLLEWGNPIGKLARIFSPDLVRLEDRLSWLDGRLSSYAKSKLHTARTAYGLRGARLRPEDPAPEIVIDLGAEYPLDSIYLIPATSDPTEPEGLFPRRFTIEASTRPDFSQSRIVYSTSSHAPAYPNPGIAPTRFPAAGTLARYIKLTINEGVNRELRDLFSLSEIIAVSNQQPVSLNASVRCTSALTIPGLWEPSFLTDGRSPLGVWQAAIPTSSSKGDLVETTDPSDQVSWSVDLGTAHPLKRLVLFPYDMPSFADGASSSRKLQIWVSEGAGGEERLAADLSGALADMSGEMPLVIPLQDQPIRRVRITGNHPLSLGGRYLQGFSEIELWDGSSNLADGLPVLRQQGGVTSTVTSLTDRVANQCQILGMDNWLKQLNERKRFELERSQLTPIRNQMASENELNATWGLAIAIGMTFLIPVGILERRRLVSRNQIEQLRKRIASDLHDDIGSNLGCITLIAGSARKDLVRLQGPEVVVDDLGEVEIIARESSLAMRDIVWLLERRQDSIGDLVQRMRETAGRLLREIDYTIECRSTKTANKLSLDAKRHLFLFYKEAIHNVVKHAKASHVTVVLGDHGDQLILEVRDDGVGLPVREDSRQAAVRKLQERARVLEGDLHIESTSESGTLLRLAVKRSHLLAANPVLSV
ncbi:MAG TPA: histidine kinase [Rariglobus sp.]